jgi:radical SAM superfamily enzyme YgiQ (UPF0313 family)
VVDEVTGLYPPLGLLYVAGAIERCGRHGVGVVDAVAEGLDAAGVQRRVRQMRPDVVGIQALTFTLVDALEAAEAAKRAAPAARVVMGGPHANLFPEETLAFPAVDFLLLGEGESNIAGFLDEAQEGGPTAGVPGIVLRGQDGGGAAFGPPNPLIEDLDALPMPARHLLDNARYASVLGKGKRLTTIMSSRGCPARCVFCDRPHLGKRFRARSAESVAEEMERCLRDLGVDEFFFYDDTFTIDGRRVFAVCEEVRRRGLKVSWDIRARVSSVDREMLRALRDAGCARIHFGIESGNERVLKTIRKGVDLEGARQVFAWCRELGIESLAYFMFGFPGEGPAEAEDTVRYALSLRCDYVHVAATTPFPGTELYRMGMESGLYRGDPWREFARRPSPDFVPPLWEESLSRDQLSGFVRRLYRGFYGRPGYVLRQAMRVRSVPELRRKARAGARLLLRTA